MSERAILGKGEVKYEICKFSGVSITELLQLVLALEDASKKKCLGAHTSYMYELYMAREDKQAALQQAVLAALGVHLLDDDDANNVGYVLLSCDRTEEAAKVLEIVRDRSPLHSLARYNLGLARLSQNAILSARQLFEEVVHLEHNRARTNVGALLYPEYADGTLTFGERMPGSGRAGVSREAISLADAAKAALELLQTIES